jgi:hypothetical protein
MADAIRNSLLINKGENAMKKLFVLFAFVAFSSAAIAGELVVVANGNVKLSSGEVADVFTGEKVAAGSVKLVPVDNKEAQADFLSKVVKLDSGKYNAAWAKKSFQDGLTPPKVKSTDAEVIEFVKSTPGAIGYVSNGGAASAAGLTTIGKF